MKRQNPKLPIKFEDQEIALMMKAAGTAYSMKSYEHAMNIYEGVKLLRPQWSRPLVGEGAVEYAQRNVSKAEAAYRGALKLDPKDQEAHLYLGELLWNEHKDSAKASKHLGRAFELKPMSPIGERAKHILKQVRSAA